MMSIRRICAIFGLAAAIAAASAQLINRDAVAFLGLSGGEAVRISSARIVSESHSEDIFSRLYCLGATFPIDRISFAYEGSNCESVVTAYKSDASGRKFLKLVESPLAHEIALESGNASSVLVEITRCPWKVDVDFWTRRSAWREYMRALKLDKREILGRSDLSNPCRTWGSPITEYHRWLANSIVDAAHARSELERAVALMNHITWFDVGYPCHSTVTGTLLERVGSCGGYQFSFQALATSLGMMTRSVNLYNWPKDNGHSVCECKIDGKWAIFDPTYGVYYKNRESGTLMSFADLRNPANVAVPVCLNLRRQAQSGEKTGWCSQQVYLKAAPAGPIGPDCPMLFPLSLSLNRPKIELPSPTHQGGDYLGCEMVNANHRWTLSGLAAGKKYCLILNHDFIGGNDKDLSSFALPVSYENAEGADRQFSVKGGEASDVKLPFTALKDTVHVAITHPYRGPCTKYLPIRSVELVDMQGR